MLADHIYSHLSSWLQPNDIKPLPKHEIDAYLKSTSKKQDGKLFAAYTLASDPEDFIAEQDELRRHKDDVDEELPEDEDELADDNEEAEPEVKPGNKRKRIAADQKPAKKEPAAKKTKTEKAPSKRVSTLFQLQTPSHLGWMDIPSFLGADVSAFPLLLFEILCYQATKKEAAAEDGEEPVSKKASTSKAAANKKAPASAGKKAAAPTSAAKESKESKEAKEDAGDGTFLDKLSTRRG
jgi:hypothetical protein